VFRAFEEVFPEIIQQQKTSKEFFEFSYFLELIKSFLTTTPTRESLKLKRHHCLNIWSFARQFNSPDILKFAIENCAYIKNYYPVVQCEHIEYLIRRCREEFALKDL
ncbi:unnamed protein product, partial [Dracunculus medinensis]|uniref:Ras-GEF domain-containing protein n=1 Tax=Dracunculus medinensis TaxID=318479 RepID=A0A0N4U435_DRAME